MNSLISAAYAFGGELYAPDLEVERSMSCIFLVYHRSLFKHSGDGMSTCLLHGRVGLLE